MKKLRAQLYAVYGGLQACSFSVESQAVWYLDTILKYLQKKDKHAVKSNVLNDVEKYCPGFLNYLCENKSFNVKKVEDKIISFTLPEIGEVQVIYKE